MNEVPMREACAAARESMHRLLDGGPVAGSVRAELDRHLESCPRCAEDWTGLREMQAALRALPIPPMPDAALDAVFVRTRSMRPEPAVPRFGLDWRAAAAAALLASGLWGLWGVKTAVPESYTVAEQEAAAAEARLALKLVADALGRAGKVGMGVLSQEVAPALERVPMKLPTAPTKDSRT